MKPVTIILGDQCSGKSTKARELTVNKKTEWLQSLRAIDMITCPPDTEVMVLDELRPMHIETLKMLITSKTISIFRQGKPSVEIERPELIIISNTLKQEDFGAPRSHVKFIHMHRSAEPNY